MVQRYLADTARRFIDDAQKRQVIAWVEEQAQIGDDVFVFFAVEEGQAADDLERNALADKGGFQVAR
jgi:hypothetical protein